MNPESRLLDESPPVCLPRAAAASAAMPLAGWTIILTRPAGEAARQIAQLRALGADAHNLALLRMAPATADNPVWQHIDAIADDDLVFPVSPVAARLLLQHWGEQRVRAQRHWLAVGPATARVLQDAGVQSCAFPARQHDSEGLLAMAQCQRSAMEGQRVWIIAAAGGRTLIAETLSARGARVRTLHIYRRLPLYPAARALARLCALPQPVCVLSSATALSALQRLPVRHLSRMQQSLLLVPGDRLAELACRAGFRHIQLSGSASSESQLAALLSLASKAQSP